jgi:DNA-binding response OmpR family regulator
MKLGNLYILFVGDPHRGRRLVEMATTRGWTVKCPTEMMQALAECASCKPDLVILDRFPESELAKSVFFHLRTIEYGPFLALNDAPGSPKFIHLHFLSFIRMMDRSSNPAMIIEAISDLVSRSQKSRSRQHLQRHLENTQPSQKVNRRHTKAIRPYLYPCNCTGSG